MLYSLGVDAAAAGAAVLIQNDTKAVLMAFAWRQRERAGNRLIHIDCVDMTGGRPVSSLRMCPPVYGMVGAFIAARVAPFVPGGFGLAVEDAVAGRSPAAAISVAKRGGMVAGHLEPLCTGQFALWPKATEWRANVLGLPARTKTDDAKAISLTRVKLIVPGLDAVLRLLGPTRDDISDAAGIAVWRSETTQSEWTLGKARNRAEKRAKRLKRKTEKQ